ALPDPPPAARHRRAGGARRAVRRHGGLAVHLLQFLAAMRLLVRLLLLALLAYAAGAVLLVRENPEAAFWGDLRARQDAELAKLRESYPGTPVILFAGGSSAAFSVDPALVTATCGVLAVNL